ncbi:MAG: DUF1232 domain-containing protein [Bacteroidetes bacterium]|nr:DUF1232 domain-containing protein [Bacteroidota bacterium]
MLSRIRKYAVFFSESSFWNTVQSYSKKIGIKSVYAALLLFYAFKRKETPTWAKNIIIGVLGYLIAPIDLLPDLTPFIGYTDDLGVLGVGLVAIASYVNEAVKSQAKSKLRDWFGNYNAEELENIDQKL